jgi:hypothetical protein
MRHTIVKTALAIVLTCSLLGLQAFNVKGGQDSFEIYLNNKLILRQAVTKSLTLQSLQLNKANINDQLVIYYNHCGTTGKGRSIAIKDDKGNILKEWKFADASGSNTGMTISVKELLQLEKNYEHSQLNLFYASEQLPKGRMLSALEFTGKSTTWRSQQELWLVWAAAFV